MRAWDEFLALQEVELGVKATHKWLKTLKVISFDACNLYLEAKDTFQLNWFEEHIRPKIQNQFVNNNKKKIKVHLTLSDFPKESKKEGKVITQKPAPLVLNFDQLDPQCTFEYYVPTEKNVLAEKLLRHLVQPLKRPKQPEIFNPIYIHGSSGTGKTHLLMATAHALRSQGKKVIYCRAETFTEHVVAAIRVSEMSQFRQTYRNNDVLIIDDIQVLSGKTATQEEFFHTFNSLHLENKQIILSGNVSPAELSQIEPRLISRFEWGVVLRLAPFAENELRQIVSLKAKFLKFPMHNKIVDFLIDHFKSGSKSLIKALEALVLRNHLNKQTSSALSLPSAKQFLKDLLLEEQRKALTPERMIQWVAEVFGIKAEDIVGKEQKREYVFARQIAMFLCRHQLKMTYIKIAHLFHKDHSTVMTSVKLIQGRIDSNDKEVFSVQQSIQKKLDMNQNAG